MFEKFFAAVCIYSLQKHVETTAYYPQTDDHVEKFNKIIAVRLLLFVVELQNDYE